VGGRRTNLALLFLLALAFLTGWLAFAFFGWPSRLVLVVHALAGIGLLLLVPWKSLIARRALSRRRRPRVWWASLLLGLGLAISLAFGFLHSAGRWYVGGDLTAMEFHVGAAICILPFAVWHVLARPLRVRRAEVAALLTRRSFLRLGAFGAAAAGALLVLPQARRSPSGSYELGSFAPAEMPGTQWMFDSVPVVSGDAAVLSVGGRRVGYGELARFSDTVRCQLDCTGGWYATQDWEGVWLSRLLGPAPAWARSILVRSVTGYSRRFPVESLPALLLAVRAGSLPLDPAHGFPARLVAPGQRGFWWVKWVSSVELDALPDWWQAPFPLQ